MATGIATLPLTKVYFFWISRDKTAFEWFGELLAALEEACEPGSIFFRDKSIVFSQFVLFTFF